MAELIVWSPVEGVVHLTDADFRAAAERKWTGAVTFRTSEDPQMPPVTADVEVPGQRSFQVFLLRGGDAVVTDGSEEQMAEVAAWVRSLLPEEPGGRIWFTDPGCTGHYDLPHGVTPQDVIGSWVEHGGEAPT